MCSHLPFSHLARHWSAAVNYSKWQESAFRSSMSYQQETKVGFKTLGKVVAWAGGLILSICIFIYFIFDALYNSNEMGC